jgi:hypothetical protein
MPRVGFLCFAPILALVFGFLSNVYGQKSVDPPSPPPSGTDARDAGEAFCPAKQLLHGATVIPSARCYLMAILRDRRGTYLAFAPADTHLTPARPVRLDTPAAPTLRDRLLLVPLATEVPLVPVNSLMLVPTRIDDSGARLRFVVLGTAAADAPAAVLDQRAR